MFIEKFKIRFRELIDLMGKTKNRCSEMIGISYQTLMNIYTVGKVPNIRQLIRVADYFNVSIDYLLGRTDEK